LAEVTLLKIFIGQAAEVNVMAHNGLAGIADADTAAGEPMLRSYHEILGRGRDPTEK